MDEKKIYVGSGKKMKDFARSISVCLTDLPTEFIFEYNGKKYIKLNVVDKKEADKFGKDIFVAVDTFKPEKGGKSKPAKKVVEEDESSDLPF